MAAYPYFGSHASVIGRLLGLQETVSAQQIRRRITQHWGDRSTVHRTSRHVVRTMVAWGVLAESGKGVYKRGDRAKVMAPAALRLIGAVLFRNAGGAMELVRLMSHPALFPFEFDLDVTDIRGNGGLEVTQDGVGTVMVGLREIPATAVQALRG